MFTIGPPAMTSLSCWHSILSPLNITYMGFSGLLNTVSPSVPSPFKY